MDTMVAGKRWGYLPWGEGARLAGGDGLQLKGPQRSGQAHLLAAIGQIHLQLAVGVGAALSGKDSGPPLASIDDSFSTGTPRGAVSS